MSTADISSLPKILLLSQLTGARTENPILAPSLGVYYLEAYLSKRGVSVTVFDQDLDVKDQYLADVRAGKYDIVGFSVTHANILEDLELLWEFKASVDECGKRVIVIGGGQEATMNSEAWLNYGLELIFTGFAQKTLMQFCLNWAHSKDTIDTASIESLTANIHGISYLKEGGKLFFLPNQPFAPGEVQELLYEEIVDDLKLPYHAFWNKLRTTHANVNMGAAKFTIENARLFTTSHCPRACGFCNSQTFLPMSVGSKMPITYLSGEQAADLILKSVEKYGALGFSFNDDDFLIGHKLGIERGRDICRRVIEFKRQGLIHPDTAFSCQTRVHNFVTRNEQNRRVVDVDLIALMKEAGFVNVSMGVETFIPRIMKAPSINKVGITDQEIIAVIDALIDGGITPQVNIIIGIPEYTVDELIENFYVVLDCYEKGCDVGVNRFLLALPGAPIYGSDKFSTVDKEWTHPTTGAVHKIPDFFVPFDPKVRQVVEEMAVVHADEMRKIVMAFHWESKITPRRVVNLVSMLSAAKILGNPDLIERLSGVLDKTLKKNQAMSRQRLRVAV